MATSAVLLVGSWEVEISVDGRKKKQLPNIHDAGGLDSGVTSCSNNQFEQGCDGLRIQRGRPLGGDEK